MKHRVLAFGSLLALGLSLSGSGRAAEVMDKPAFDKTLARIQAAAQNSAFVEANDPLLNALAREAYGPESLEPFKAALAAQPVTEVGVFTAARLLAPLLSTDVELVRKAVPAVLAAHGRLVRYLPLPQFSAAELKAMDLPPAPDPRAPADVNLKILSDYAQRRQKRMEAEGRALRTNVQNMVLEMTVWRVLLRTGQNSEDDRVLAAVAKGEQDHLTTYRLPLIAIIFQAPQLEQARAARFRTALEKQGRALELAEGNYVDPDEIRLGTTTNSYFHAPICRPGLDILTTANVLAPVAQAPPVAIAPPEEVAAFSIVNKVRPALAAGGKKLSTENQRLVESLFGNYPDTKAAQDPVVRNYAEAEAANLLNSARTQAAAGKKEEARKDLYTLLRLYPKTRAAQDGMVKDYAETQAAALLARAKAAKGDAGKKEFDAILRVFPKTKAAEDPAVKAFAEEEAADLMKSAKDSLRRNQVPQARWDLLTVLRYYAQTKAAPEAQKLLDSIPYKFW